MVRAMQDNCVVPKGFLFDKDGYPRFKSGGRLYRVNRWLWEKVNGSLDPDLVVAHSCNNKSCINTNHFYLTTSKQNSSDAARDGLYLTEERHPKFKLEMETMVLYKRYNNGESQQAIADDVGISQSALSARFIRYKRKGIFDVCGDKR